jgi:hypothetical protein
VLHGYHGLQHRGSRPQMPRTKQVTGRGARSDSAREKLPAISVSCSSVGPADQPNLLRA